MTRTEPPAALRPGMPAAGPATATRANYDRLARWYDRLVGPFERHARTVALRLLAPQRGERVLEIGCGTGTGLREIAEAVGPAGRAVGIDLSPRMAARAESRIARAGLDGWTRVLVVAAPPLPFEDASFDAVFMCFTLEVLRPDGARAALLRDCRRVLAPDGRLVCAAVSAREPRGAAAIAYGAAHRRFGSIVDCSPILAADVVAAAGFTVSTRLGLRLWGLPVDVVEGRS